MRVWDDDTDMGATRTSQIDLTTTGVDGPGQTTAYLITSFGQLKVTFAASDSFSTAGGYDTDTAQLPADAHQHISQAFIIPGVYCVCFRANLRAAPSATPVSIGEGSAVFAVGTPPEEIAASEDRRALSADHADTTVNLTAKHVEFVSGARALNRDEASAPHVGGGTTGAAAIPTMEYTDLNQVAIEVPTRVPTTIPEEAPFRFISEPGASVYMLPQVVFGKHIRGDIDLYLWHDVHNAQAYVRVTHDSLISVDPDSGATYQANAVAYSTRLDELDTTMASIVVSIPEERRKLITTNDTYAYLASTYGFTVAGFVAPDSSVEPSVTDRIKLQATLSDSSVPAVFLEPNLARTRSTLRTTATDASMDICPLYGDALDNQAPTYIDMMEHNARPLTRCLGDKEMSRTLVPAPFPAEVPSARTTVGSAPRGRRPAREITTRELRSEWSTSKPGQTPPPPPGLAGGLSASPVGPCHQPRDRTGGCRNSSCVRVPPPMGGMAALETPLQRIVGASRL